MKGLARGVIAAGISAALVLLSGCVAQRSEPSLTPSMQEYLAGYEYLRGVNLYSLQQQRALRISKVEADTAETYQYLASRGISIIRLAVPWQGLQPLAEDENPRRALSRPVDEGYLDLVTEQARYAHAAGVRLVIDLHNGCTYPWGTGPEPRGTLYCGDGLTVDDVLKVWRALSDRLVDEPGVAAYNLFNEPRKTTGAATYYRYVNVIVADLRARGDRRAIWVDSILNSSFASDSLETAPITDPAGAIIYSQHFYLHGGTRESLLSRIRDFGEWCGNHGVHCSVGEIGWPADGSRDKTETFELAYQLVDHYGMDATYFGATSIARPRSLIAYYSSGRDGAIDARRDQADVIENHPSRRQVEENRTSRSRVIADN